MQVAQFLDGAVEQELERIVNMNALRQRSPHSWPPSQSPNLPDSDTGPPRSRRQPVQLLEEEPRVGRDGFRGAGVTEG